MPYAVAVDIGGTFTDLVAYDNDGRQLRLPKSPTTYDNLRRGVLDCFRKVELAPRTANFVNHGTTLVINALLSAGRKAALLTTQGFRDVLEIARGNRPEPFDLHYRRDEPLIPRRELRIEVKERITAKGEVRHAPQHRGEGAAGRRARAAIGVEAIAVSFLTPMPTRRTKRGADILRR